MNIWRQKSRKLDFIFGERTTALVPWWYVEQADEVSKHDSCRLLNGQLGSQATCRANKQLQCFIIFGFCTICSAVIVGICGGQGGLIKAVLSSRNELRHMKYTPIIIKLRPRQPANEVDSVLIANQEGAALPRCF